jgi:hypothetical protein
LTIMVPILSGAGCPDKQPTWVLSRTIRVEIPALTLLTLRVEMGRIAFPTPD